MTPFPILFILPLKLLFNQHCCLATNSPGTVVSLTASATITASVLVVVGVA